MADVKWSDNAAFPQATIINDIDSLMGLQGGANTEFPIGLISNHIFSGKQFIAGISQSGTDAPVKYENFNNTGSTFTLSRIGEGVYFIDSSVTTLFNIGFTGIRINVFGCDDTRTEPRFFIANAISGSRIVLSCFSQTGAASNIDGFEAHISIQIFS